MTINQWKGKHETILTTDGTSEKTPQSKRVHTHYKRHKCKNEPDIIRFTHKYEYRMPTTNLYVKQANSISAHSFFIFSSPRSRLFSFVADSEMASNRGIYSSKQRSMIFERVKVSSALRGKPTISETRSQWRAFIPGLPSVCTIGRFSRKASIFSRTCRIHC